MAVLREVGAGTTTAQLLRLGKFNLKQPKHSFYSVHH